MARCWCWINCLWSYRAFCKTDNSGEDVPLAADGTFRIQVPFRDGIQKYDIRAVDVSGEQEKSITMKFDRTTPLDDTNEKDNAETEWF